MSNGIFSEMIGKTMVSVVDNGDLMLFVDSEGNRYEFYHERDCCEHVSIEDVCGDLRDLEGSPILQAEEVWGAGPSMEMESYTWTFYKYATNKGSVTVRWLGRSNGYYSESVSYKVNGVLR